MKISFPSYLGLYLYLARTLILADENFLVAISPLDETENWSQIQERLRIFHGIPQEEEATHKNEICRRIVESPFIRDTFHVHSIENNSPKIIANGSLIKVPNNIVGPYVLREISLNGVTSHHFVFPCLSWNYDLKKFVKLFISRQANFDRPSFAPFRLIFKKSKKGVLVAKAIAEKPAKIVKNDPTFTENEVTELVELEDEICKMTKAMQIRLCTIILSADKYDREGVIPSYAYNASDGEPECLETDIQFRNSDEDLEETSVWTLECKAMTNNRVGVNKSLDFHIFQGLKTHSIFTATKKDEELIYVLDELHI